MKKMGRNGSVERLKSKNANNTAKATICPYTKLWVVNICGPSTLSLQLITCTNSNKVIDFAMVPIFTLLKRVTVRLREILFRDKIFW